MARYIVGGAHIVIDNDGLYISTRATANESLTNTEIVSWNVDEVRDEPELAFTIANALMYLLENGAEEFAHSIGKEILEDGEVRVLSGHECANCGAENDHPTSECPHPDESGEEDDAPQEYWTVQGSHELDSGAINLSFDKGELTREDSDTENILQASFDVMGLGQIDHADVSTDQIRVYMVQDDPNFGGVIILNKAGEDE